MDDAAVILLTPVAARDVERCELLLESLGAHGTPFRHVVVVNTEDLSTAGARLRAHSPHVEILATAEVLDARTERRRSRPISRKRPGYWIGGHWRDEPRIYGWFLQQILKLSFAATADCAAVVCVDSDLVALRRLAVDDFVADDVAVLLQAPVSDAEMASWEIDALRFLEVPLQGTPMYRHTVEPCVLSPAATRELIDHLGAGWIDRFQKAGLTEYALHATWRRFRSAVPLRTAAPADLVHSVRGWDGDLVAWEAAVAEASAAGAAFFHAHSGLDLPLAEIRAAVGIA